jgi:hypothetical protein
MPKLPVISFCMIIYILRYNFIIFKDLDVGSGQTISFILNDEYKQIKHIFGALSKFLHISSDRMKNHELSIENGHTNVSFTLYDVDDLNQESNFHIIKELKQLINDDKYIIVDLNLKKTIKAIKGSCKFGITIHIFM